MFGRRLVENHTLRDLATRGNIPKRDWAGGVMRAILLIGFFLFAAVAARAEDLLRSDLPGWVDILPSPEPKSENMGAVAGGVYDLVYDTQVHWSDVQRATVVRWARKVIGRAGLETAANVAFDFDPGSSTLTLNRLDIIRGGVRIDLRDCVAASIYRRETNLEEGIVDGSVAALVL